MLLLLLLLSSLSLARCSPFKVEERRKQQPPPL